MTPVLAPNRICHTCGVAWLSHRDPDPCWSCGQPCSHGAFTDLYREVGRVGPACSHRYVEVGE